MEQTIKAKWIWLNKAHCPGDGKAPVSVFCPDAPDYPYVVAAFKKHLTLPEKALHMTVRLTADTKFWLYVNGQYTAAGPVGAGGDFATKQPMPWQYYNTYEIACNSTDVEFYVLVQNIPSQQCDMSNGQSGLWLEADITLADGSAVFCGTDETWEAGVCEACAALNVYDYSGNENGTTISCEHARTYLVQDDRNLWYPAEPVENIWNLKKPGIPMLVEEEVRPEQFEPFSVTPGETRAVTVTFEKIFSIYHILRVSGNTSYKITITDFERAESGPFTGTDTITGTGDLNFRGLSMFSAGGIILTVTNTGEEVLTVEKIAGSFIHYPVEEEGSFACSEEVFTKIYNMGKHALKICRQSIELDSPKHQENLGCAGDYCIASLMNYFAYGDARLTRLDIVRIADSIRQQDGYAFHTTYSMIWVTMVYDYYQYTGDYSLLTEVWDAIVIVLRKMASYAGKNGIVDNPPSYMFVDWLVVDGISLHHPPMALGQAVLNAFYIGAVKHAVLIGEAITDGWKDYRTGTKEGFGNVRAEAEIGIGEDPEGNRKENNGHFGLSESAVAEQCGLYREQYEALCAAFHTTFYDEATGLYFDGCNTPHATAYWLPENVDKRYFSWHTNSLAVLYDIAPKAEQERILRRILTDKTLIDPQPYFMHFVLEAIEKLGLYEEFGMPQLMRWKDMTAFEKGLQEGWYDVSGYGFDYSHVWCGTPTYQLPSKLSGLQMIEPGFKKIILQPRLYGLDWMKTEIPTPYGKIKISMEKGGNTLVEIPKGIDAEVKKHYNKGR